MKNRHGNLPQDLQALRYLDALDAGDLETVAALWDDAADDVELEAMLAEIDDALAVEAAAANDNATKAAVKSNLRGDLTPPTRTPTPSTVHQWHWAVAVGGLAAACLLAVFAWNDRIHEGPITKKVTPEHTAPIKPRPQIDSAGIAALRESWRILEGQDTRPFVWSLPESSLTASASIPADLLR